MEFKLKVSKETAAKIDGGITMIHGLDPWVDENSEVLILGTLPSQVSIDTNFYYNKTQLQNLLHSRNIQFIIRPSDMSLQKMS